MRRTCSPLTIVALLALQGCYVNAPLLEPAPRPGETVVLQISDRGRVALAERLGTGVNRIQGRVTNVSDDLLSLNVASVAYISGDKSLWSGEAMTLNREMVGSTQVRRLSKARTWTAVGATTVVVGTFIATRGLFAFLGDLPDGPGDGGEGPTTFRLKIGFPF